METVPKEAFEFLAQLKNNNEREWFNERKPRFKTLEQQMKRVYGEIENRLNKHDSIQKVKAFRIYRDVRFSKDKTPYKTHFAAHFVREKPVRRGGYYVHITPGNRSFIGCGFWKPNKDDLKRIRKEWEIDAEEIRAILKGPTLADHWGAMTGSRLKTAPRGFDRNLAAIDLINHKQWIFTHALSDHEVLRSDFTEIVDSYFRSIRPFFDYMSSVLTTDLNGVSLIDD